MSATIYQFVPKPNPNRDVLQGVIGVPANPYSADDLHDPQNPNVYPADCGNAIWPWPEKDGA